MGGVLESAQAAAVAAPRAGASCRPHASPLIPVARGPLSCHSLRKRLPEKKEELDAFKKHLLETEAVIKELKVRQGSEAPEKRPSPPLLFLYPLFVSTVLFSSSYHPPSPSSPRTPPPPPPFQPWEIQELGLQASQRILSSQDPLRVMQTLAQNFPVLSHTLVGGKVEASTTAQIEHNQRLLGQLGLPPGSSLVAINNVIQDTGGVDLFSMLSTVGEHSALVAKLSALGVPADAIENIQNVQYVGTDAGRAAIAPPPCCAV